MPYFTYGKGLGIGSPDSLFLLNIRFRMQNRFALESKSESDLTINEVEARVRRLRLRFDGFVYSKKLTYVIQLSFSRADMDYDILNIPNVVRDAMIFYSPTPKLTLGLGQTKLPGNRQRVNSSGDLQLADRSIVNSTFNIDRDFGVQAFYRDNLGGMHYVVRAALSSGEGRNFNSSDNGMAYTGRLEILPLGTFKNNGDYFEGDLEREITPKIAFGVSYNKNLNAVRTGGQLGKFLYQPRDIETSMADFILKYRGFAFMMEYIYRYAHNPITIDVASNDAKYVYTGHGQNYQASYLFKNNIEITGRYSEIIPEGLVKNYERNIKQYTIGASKYFKGHRVKFQTDLTYEEGLPKAANISVANNWQLRFQFELGI